MHIHEVARRHLGKAAEHQEKNYDKQVSSKPFQYVDSQWLHNIPVEEREEPQAGLPLEPLLSCVCAVQCNILHPKKVKTKAEGDSCRSS